MYGTLREGFCNHVFLKDSKKIGDAYTAEDFSLYFRDVQHVIAIPRSKIYDEIYEVDDETLMNIDNLQGHPHWYKREIVRVICGNQELKAWINMYPHPAGEQIASGNYADYQKVHNIKRDIQYQS